ncbi:hypothetical protein [Rhodococcus coprophilus]|uniref:hypothetical protein n=1 Tax=Rhodococcus coprophilus TaxID=38310 RepID=UPI0033F7DC7B
MSVEEPIRHVEVVGGGGTEGLQQTTKILARELTLDDVGKFIGCHEDGVNYQAKILKLEIYESGPAPGVDMILRHGAIPTRPARTEGVRLRFETELELIELIAL